MSSNGWNHNAWDESVHGPVVEVAGEPGMQRVTTPVTRQEVSTAQTFSLNTPWPMREVTRAYFSVSASWGCRVRISSLARW